MALFKQKKEVKLPRVIKALYVLVQCTSYFIAMRIVALFIAPERSPLVSEKRGRSSSVLMKDKVRYTMQHPAF